MEQPLVTVYTITRNRADLLPRCMRSVLNQTYRNIEYVVIDSASTDNTKDVVSSFGDKRIRYVRLEDNKTCGACINMAFGMATGKYITGLDDDDEYHLDKIEKQVSLFESLSNDYGMVYCWMTYFDNTTKKELDCHKANLKGDVYYQVVAEASVSGTPSLMVRKNVIEKIGGFKEADEVGIESDWEYACRICRVCKVEYVPESLVNVYVNHSHRRMSNKYYYKDLAKRNIKFEQYFLKEFKDAFEENPPLKINHLYLLSRSYFAIHKFRDAIRFYMEMLKFRPSCEQVIKPWISIFIGY